MRRAAPVVPNGHDSSTPSEEEPLEEQFEEQFEELVVLDSAGRLQIPKEYLSELNIKGRVRIEMTEDGILIQPVPDELQTEEQPAKQIEIIVEANKNKQQANWVRGLQKWLGRS